MDTSICHLFIIIVITVIIASELLAWCPLLVTLDFKLFHSNESMMEFAIFSISPSNFSSDIVRIRLSFFSIVSVLICNANASERANEERDGWNLYVCRSGT